MRPYNTCKVLMMVLLERLKPQVATYKGFRSDRNTTLQILILRLLAEKVRRKGKKGNNCFIDFQKAFNSVIGMRGSRTEDNVSKTKTLVFASETIKEQMKVNNTDLENVTEFEYLGSLLSWDNDCGKAIRKKIAKALGAMAELKMYGQAKKSV